MAERRLLALDPGERRTGVAVSDALGLYAHPRRAVHHTDRDGLVAAVERLVADEGVDEVIVGLPLTLSGAESAQTRTTRELVGLLRQRLSVPVTPWDERLSTRQAERYVSGAARRRSGEQDSAAAALILQAVLDRRRGATIP
jgi:putative Holliday junction resolvase